MKFVTELVGFQPSNEQEAKDRQVILDYVDHFKDGVLFRSNEIGHITSSAFIVNKSCDKALMIYHNLRDVWAWTGGHVDGDEDFLGVAVREAMEETGIAELTPLSDGIASMDILNMQGHIKNGKYVNCHLHLSVAYMFSADEHLPVRIRPQENKAVRWMDFSEFTESRFDKYDLYLYRKLIGYAKKYMNQT